MLRLCFGAMTHVLTSSDCTDAIVLSVLPHVKHLAVYSVKTQTKANLSALHAAKLTILWKAYNHFKYVCHSSKYII